MPQQKFGKIIQSVQRAIDIINCFDDVATELTLGEISAALDLNKSTVHGILNTLHNNEFIRQNANGKYMLGQALLRKYHFTDSARRALLMEEAKAEMTRIANEYHVNSSIYMLELGELLLVNRILPENEMYTVTCISDSYLNPLYCTASGKILLANLAPAELEGYISHHELVPMSTKTIVTEEDLRRNLEDIRKNGYSDECEELGLGVSALSVPIYDPDGGLFGTVSVTGMAFHVLDSKPDLIFDLKTLSRKLTKLIF